MKKRKILLAALCAWLVGTAVAQTVTVPDVEALPGETVAFSMNLKGGKADTYTSLQFNIQFSATGYTTTGDYTISTLWKNASATVGDVDATGLAIVPVSSAEVITGSDVDNLLTVKFTVGSEVAVGDYDVTLSKITFGYGFTDKDVAADVTFQVHVVERHTVVLDENSTEAPSEAEDVNVTVKRTINAGEWSTICLPFAMTAEQVKAAFGSDVELADFAGCETEEDDDDNTVGITVNFNTASEIEANHPYIINVPESLTEFSVSGVDITEAEEGELKVDRNELEYTYTVNKKTYTGYMYNSFVGTYVAQTTVPNMSLFLSGSQFWYSAGSTKMKAFRAYFDFYDVLTEVDNAYNSSRITMRFIDDDGETTGISATLNEKGERRDENVYDLQGRRVASSILKKGMYVKDGKKVIIK